MVSSLKSFAEYLTKYAAEYPDKKMLGGPEGWFSVGQTHALAETAAWKFRALGIHAGNMVALRAERRVVTIIAILGLRLIGAVVVLTDPHNDVRAFLNDAIVPVPVIAEIDIIDASSLSVTVSGKTEIFSLFELPQRQYAAPKHDSRETGFLIFTSGSTGKRKGVMLSEYNLVNNLVDSQPLGYYFEDDIALGALPLDHVFGLVLLAGTMVLRYSLYLPGKTDILSILRTIQDEKITRMNGVPALYVAMAEQKQGYDLSSLRAGFVGGSPLTAEQFCRIEEELSMILIPVYGMSECIGISCASYRDPRAIRAVGVGPFYSMNIGKILREDGTEAECGEEGEICVDGPARMVGYYGDVTPREALFHTGDLGFVDETGVLHISGRKKELIIRNGVNLSPKRIEQALLKLSYIRAAAVVGLPDEKQGEVPYAIVVCDDKASADILTDLSECLAKNELPKEIFCVDSLPMTHSGKPDKRRIREVVGSWVSG